MRHSQYMESIDRQFDSIELNTFKTAYAWCTTPRTLETLTVLGIGRQPLSPWNLEWRLGKIKIKQKQLNNSKVETDVVMMDIMGILMVWFKINSLYSLIIEDLLQSFIWTGNLRQKWTYLWWTRLNWADYTRKTQVKTLFWSVYSVYQHILKTFRT